MEKKQVFNVVKSINGNGKPFYEIMTLAQYVDRLTFTKSNAYDNCEHKIIYQGDKDTCSYAATRCQEVVDNEINDICSHSSMVISGLADDVYSGTFFNNENQIYVYILGFIPGSHGVGHMVTTFNIYEIESGTGLQSIGDNDSAINGKYLHIMEQLLANYYKR